MALKVMMLRAKLAPLQEQLNQRFPQYNIIVMYMATGKAAARSARKALPQKWISWWVWRPAT